MLPRQRSSGVRTCKPSRKKIFSVKKKHEDKDGSISDECVAMGTQKIGKIFARNANVSNVE